MPTARPTNTASSMSAAILALRAPSRSASRIERVVESRRRSPFGSRVLVGEPGRESSAANSASAEADSAPPRSRLLNLGLDGSSSARRRCRSSRERTPTSRPPSTTGTRSASCSSRKRKASSTGRSASIVQCGSSAISASGVAPGSRPVATTSRTSVFRVTTPTSRPSLHTNTARTSGRESASPASCAVASALHTRGSVIIASRTTVTGRSLGRRARPQLL